MTTTPEPQKHTEAPWWAPGGTRCAVCGHLLAGVLDVLAHQQTHDQKSATREQGQAARKARPARCGNDPTASLTDGDRVAVEEFRAFLTDRKRQSQRQD